MRQQARLPRPELVRRQRWAVAGWAVLVVVAVAWGAAGGPGERSQVRAGPFVGHWHAYLGWRLLPAVAIGVAAVVAGPWLAARLPWRHLVLAAAGLTLAWAVALNWVDGPGALTASLRSRYDYLRYVPAVESPATFLDQFVDKLPREATHVKSHPPGMVLVLWTMDRLGLGGAGPAAALVLAGGAAAVAAALVALRDVAGERAARTAAPFLALAPAAVWTATAADAFWAGVTACGVAAVILATSRQGRSADGWAVAGGLALGAGLFLSYGMAAILTVPAAVALYRRRWRPLVVAGAVVALLVLAFAAAGFWWPSGLAATHERYVEGVAAFRSYRYFLVGNLAAFAVAVGPATAAGLARVAGRERLLCGAALLTVVVVDLSALSKGEVERIWLPFVPWLATAACGLVAADDADDDPNSMRRWIAAQAVTALVLQAALRSPW